MQRGEHCITVDSPRPYTFLCFHLLPTSRDNVLIRLDLRETRPGLVLNPIPSRKSDVAFQLVHFQRISQHPISSIKLIRQIWIKFFSTKMACTNSIRLQVLVFDKFIERRQGRFLAIRQFSISKLIMQFDFKINNGNCMPRYSTNTCFDLIINLEECLQNHFLLLKGLSTFSVFNIS